MKGTKKMKKLLGILFFLIVIALVIYVLVHEGVFTLEQADTFLSDLIEKAKDLWTNLTTTSEVIE